MKAKTPTLLVLTLVFALVLCGAVSAANTNVTVADVQVPFIENQGQTDTSVDYYADTYYGTAYVTEDGITHSVTVDNSTGVALQEQFLNENGQPVAVDPQGEEQSQTHVNYFIGNDPSKWQTNLQTYNLVNLGELYNGITVKVRANGGNIEKLFYLQPGSNVNNILVQILGANSLQILEDGTLAIQTDAVIINMSAPQAYQGDQTVNVAYRLLSENIYGFTTGNYDDSKELIIDPTLEYSTYLGGSGNTDYGYGIAIDSSNNVFITGYTNSANFSTTTGVFQTNNSGGTDVFVTKLNPSGTGLIYSTYLGGSNNENAWSIAVDSIGNAYVTGLTNSANFPTTTGAYQTIRPGGTYDAFVFKLNPDGTGLIYSTFMGGSDNDQGYDIAVDNSGYAYITGYTKSTNFPITAGAFQTSNLNQGGIASEDAFVSKLNPDGTGLIYSTYLGGGSAGDYGYGIAIDSSCNAYIAGYTGASNFPVTPGAFQTTKSSGYDAFVSKLNPTGANLIYSTFIGATSDDYGYGIEVDNSGNAYICGVTASTSFPTTTGAFQTSNAGGQDVFVSKLNPDGNGLDYCTYIGGSGTDLGRKIVINRSGYAFITGNTGSINFPVTTGAFQTTYGGGTNDAYVSKLNPTGTSLEYNTYLGGTGAEQGRNIAIDSSGSIYITGITNSANFPVTAGAFQMVQGGGTNDAFVAKFSFESSPVAPVADFTATPTTGTAPLQVTFTNLSTDATTYAWDFDNNGTTDSTDQNPIWNYSTAGTYTIKLTATGPGGTDDEIKTGYITVSGTPDLVTSALQVPGSPVLGISHQVSATVTNSGNGDAASFVVKLYDNNIQVAKATLASLASGASNPVSFDWTPTTTGEHVLAVIADANQQITESDETNNQVSAQTTVNSSTQPDLTVTNLQLPSNPTIGTTSQVMVTVTNNGTVDSGAFVVKLYDNNTQIAKINLTGLTAGASADVTFDWLTYTTGAHNLSVIADANQQITEYNEYNNQISQAVTINPSTQPDLTVTNLQLPANPTVATNSQVTVTVTNNGTVDSGAFVVKLYDNNSQIAKINLTGLAAGASADVNFDWTTFTAGNHNLSVIADANQQITEYNENNNQISQALIVNPSTQPDLTITDLQLPANPVAGTTYQVTATNLGTVDAGAFAVKLYDNNTQLGKINITSLSAGTSTQVTFNWTPTTGTHNLAIKADANQQITEYDENNNQITQQTTVS